MTAPPRIRLEPLGIEALDMRPAQNAIRTKYGPRYHLSDECQREVAALWGIEPHHACINKHGVFESYDTLERRAGQCFAGIDYVRSPSGLWAIAKEHRSAIWGGSFAPSVWNGTAFLSEADGLAAGLQALIERIRSIAAEGGSDAADARKLIALLEAERTPQLALF